MSETERLLFCRKIQVRQKFDLWYGLYAHKQQSPTRYIIRSSVRDLQVLSHLFFFFIFPSPSRFLLHSLAMAINIAAPFQQTARKHSLRRVMLIHLRQSTLKLLPIMTSAEIRPATFYTSLNCIQASDISIGKLFTHDGPAEL